MTAPTLRALVVEDDQSWRQIISEILLDGGLEVDIAANVEEAMLALKAQPHRIAVIDLSLSPNDHNNTDGLRVLESARRLDPTCRAILLTGFATVELAVAALTDYGAFTFLRKENFQRGQFRDIVHRILASPPPPSTPEPASASTALTTSANGFTSQAAPTRDKALVVEDDAGWRNILEELLNDAGFQVQTCASFGDALGYLRRASQKISIAVIDLSLQGTMSLDGYQLLAAARTENIPTIVVSGLADTDEIQRVYDEYAISAFLEKQVFDRAAFRRAVEETRKTHQALSELNTLTDREREVLDLLAQGLTNKQIAERLVITTNTVKRHLKAIFEKLGVHTRSAATARVAGG